MLCALIMAGGKGTRFWPLSTEEKPKQFLNLIGDETMIQMTVNRIKSLIPIDRIFVCTGERYVKLVKEQLPDISERNIIVEPEGRNTAPCITLSSMVIKRYFSDATMVVLPSDHLVREEDIFRNIISKGEEFLSDYTNGIITLGMKASRAETGYGYIEVGDYIFKSKSFQINKVNKFIEKPNKENAIKYLEQGDFLWNSGVFIWKIEGILAKVKKYMPKTYEALERIIYVNEQDLVSTIKENYCNTEAISVDYGVLEKADEIYVIPSNVGWDDIGSWEAVERFVEKDENNNVVSGECKIVNAQNNMIFSKKKIIISNVNNLVVIENESEIYIYDKEADLKEIIGS